ncbi:ATP synthase F1, delta subunit [Desulfitobacterium hafniense DCB-2]|uniref:ATP synthase subunit delta n=3 Tax=Desulfitobacterium hafniense TaxID=49338 RepID=ATPD_DESHD|nr:RecName: Full=ATP synthase subunit delta; AltName: Full=ATP synthase F(1) sector subunit delta; AltName: Full=F-type ATPase subunit delta; Short=F-ATPase subunit delta [Desulfitobacterium hafniense DCB-2]ACL22789.1 ATP synthase F1, delta subunit [Desulfitobacterium hafniense DCB-2]EHL05086.1 ATP synthase F1, delta subunit [Desulfitobacterium hafniense DP7]CDX05057.1 ATP synthase subunit delta [Desulfitobacterium hafniense]
MLKGAIAQRYAQALFELAVQENLDGIEAELQELVQCVEQNAEVAHVLYHPHISLSEKKDLMNKIFAGELSVTVRNFLNLLIDRRRQNYLLEIARVFARLADEARNIVEAKVASAIPLSETQEQRLHQELARMTGKNVRMVKEVRPELIGGVMIQIGDRVMDGTVAFKLQRIRQSLSHA